MTAAMGVFIAGFSSILTGLNFIVTIHKMRAPGMTWFRLPLFVWAHYATSLIQVLGTPVVAITSCCSAWSASSTSAFSIPPSAAIPILFQHLFWFYSHPAVYIMILPGMGVISEVIDLLLAQGASSAIRFIAVRAWLSRSSAFWSGATTCSSPASRCTPAWSSRC